MSTLAPGVVGFIASGIVTTDAPGTFVWQRGFTALARGGVGDVTLTTVDAFDILSQANVLCTLTGGTGTIRWDSVSANQVRIRTFDAAGAAADRTFSILMFRVP